MIFGKGFYEPRRRWKRSCETSSPRYNAGASPVDPQRHVTCLTSSQANAFAPNWGQTIFQSANEMASNTVLRKRIEEIQSQTLSEREWWEQRRATIQSEFERDLDKPLEEVEKSKVSTPAEKGGSDEDTVLVEGGGPTAGGKPSLKKRKSKK